MAVQQRWTATHDTSLEAAELHFARCGVKHTDAVNDAVFGRRNLHGKRDTNQGKASSRDAVPGNNGDRNCRNTRSCGGVIFDGNGKLIRGTAARQASAAHSAAASPHE